MSAVLIFAAGWVTGLACGAALAVALGLRAYRWWSAGHATGKGR